jgi:hypothetical protein
MSLLRSCKLPCLSLPQPSIEELYVLFVVCLFGFDGGRRRRTAGRHS